MRYYFAQVTIPLSDISPAAAAVGRHLGNFMMFEPFENAVLLLPFPIGFVPYAEIDTEAICRELRNGPNAIPLKSLEIVSFPDPPIE